MFVEGQVSGGDQGQGDGSLGWRAALPDEFKEHEFVKTFQKPGDFVKSALEIKTERDTLKTKMANAIFKPGEKATDEERAAYFKALGRPDKAEEYEFPDKDKNAPEMVKWAQERFHKVGLNKEQATFIAGEWNQLLAGIVEKHNAGVQKEITESGTKLKAELGDKYDSSIELANRLWKKHTDGEFDKAFTGETSANRFSMIRYILKMAKLTGEDRSPSGLPEGGKPTVKEGMSYPNSPPPPKRP